MTSNELKELVKSHFNLVDASNEEVAEAFGSIKAKDGSFTVFYDGEELAVGKIVEVELPDGTRTQAPDGEHILADDTTIVTEGSRIVDIKETRTVAEEEKEEMAKDEEEKMEEDKDETKMEETEEEKMEEEVVKVEEIIEAIVSEVRDEMRKIEDKMAALEDKVQKMEATPAAEPTITSTGKKLGAENRRGFSAFNIETSKNADRIKAAMEQLRNRKK
jgi:flagellar biosynthesis GTPase FlhF